MNLIIFRFASHYMSYVSCQVQKENDTGRQNDIKKGMNECFLLLYFMSWVDEEERRVCDLTTWVMLMITTRTLLLPPNDDNDCD